jgi:hypothetical protein
MKIFLYLLLFVPALCFSQKKAVVRNENKQIFVNDTTVFHEYYLIQSPDSLWLEKPLGTFLQRLDSIPAGSSQWTTTTLGIKYDGGGGDSVCIDNTGAIRNYVGGIKVYELKSDGSIYIYDDPIYSSLNVSGLNFHIGESGAYYNDDGLYIGLNSENYNNIQSDLIKLRSETDSIEISPLSIKMTGLIYNTPPHYFSTFMDSTVVMDMTEDVPKQITNNAKTMWPDTEAVGFTTSGDTIINTYAGGYDFKFEYNAVGGGAADYRYHLKKKSGATTTTVYKYLSSNAGDTVERTMNTHVHLLAGDKLWVEVENTTNSEDITVYAGIMRLTTVHLSL